MTIEEARDLARNPARAMAVNDETGRLALVVPRAETGAFIAALRNVATGNDTDDDAITIRRYLVDRDG